ncbi:MAG: hypothetical protein M3O28_00230, partial [Actinomycetota bacterium]|nr:hypothetical protein [Actinomycetota bacterium]
MRMNKRTAMLIAAVPTVVLLLAPTLIAPSFADGGPTFSGTATSDGFDAIISNDSLPLGINPELAGPTTQASLTSLGDSDALAAFPYPGATVAGVPGLAGALFGGLPFPAYPLVVASNSSTRHVTSGAPGISLSAQSQTSSAQGQAVVGTLGNGFTTTSEVSVQSDSSVLAQSSTTLGLNLLNLVSLSGIQSSASVTADASTGQLT